MDAEGGIISQHRVPIDPIPTPVNPVHIPLTYCLFKIHRNFYRGNSDHIINGKKTSLDFTSFPNINSNFQLIALSNLIQIRPMGSKLFHVEEQTERHDEGCRKSDNARKRRPHKLRYSKTKT